MPKPLSPYEYPPDMDPAYPYIFQRMLSPQSLFCGHTLLLEVIQQFPSVYGPFIAHATLQHAFCVAAKLFSGCSEKLLVLESCGRALISLIRRLDEPLQLDEGDLFAVALLAVCAPPESSQFDAHLRGFGSIMKHLHGRCDENTFSLRPYWSLLVQVFGDIESSLWVFNHPTKIRINRKVIPSNLLLVGELETIAPLARRGNPGPTPVLLNECECETIGESVRMFREAFRTSLMSFSVNRSEDLRSYIQTILTRAKDDKIITPRELVVLSVPVLRRVLEKEGTFHFEPTKSPGRRDDFWIRDFRIHDYCTVLLALVMIVLTAPTMAQGRFSSEGQSFATALHIIVSRVDYNILKLYATGRKQALAKLAVTNELVEQALAAATNEKENIDIGRGNWPFDQILMR